METCENCKFFLGSDLEITYREGLCRRYPPKVFTESNMCGGLLIETITPATKKLDWCGEYHPKDKPHD